MNAADKIADLEAHVGRLQQLVEHLLSRPSLGPGPLPMIVNVKSASPSQATLMVWDGTQNPPKYVPAANTEPTLPVCTAPTNKLIYRPQSQQWEELNALFLGQLMQDLQQGATGGASAQRMVGDPLHETGSGSDTVYDWLLKTGGKLASGTKIIYGLINNNYYVISAACP